MTATIFIFPTPQERDDAEFDRRGTSNLIRALDEAVALWQAVSQPADRDALAARLQVFAGDVKHLARYRPDDVKSMVILDNGGMIELAAMPGMLRAYLSRRSA